MLWGIFKADNQKNSIQCAKQNWFFYVKYTKYNFDWGYFPDPAGEAYSALQDRLFVTTGGCFKGRGALNERVGKRE